MATGIADRSRHLYRLLGRRNLAKGGRQPGGKVHHGRSKQGAIIVMACDRAMRMTGLERVKAAARRDACAACLRRSPTMERLLIG